MAMVYIGVLRNVRVKVAGFESISSIRGCRSQNDVNNRMTQTIVKMDPVTAALHSIPLCCKATAFAAKYIEQR